MFRVLLPKDRTALYFVPLLTLIAAAIVRTTTDGRAARWIGRAALWALFAVACYYLLCLRLWYFKEWWWDADVRAAYPVILEYKERCSLTSADANWMYGWPLNFYRQVSGRDGFGEFEVVNERKPGKDLYILHAGLDYTFITNQKLQIVYRGRWADLVVALSPKAAAWVAQSHCYASSP